MKKALKVLGILLGIVILIIAISAITINVKGIPTYEKENIDYKLISTPESVDRGRKLASMLCANCHMNRETGTFSGKHMLDAPPEFGYVYAPNITQDKEHGIGDYSPADLAYLLRTGIKKDGTYAPPYMAKLPNMADEDLNAIISFLKSDDAMVAPASVADKPCDPSFLTKMLCNVAFKPFDMPESTIPMPDESNPEELGRYLVYNLDCYTCHSADFKAIDFINPPQTPGFLGGGNMILDEEGNTHFSSNITPHKETGIGNWSENRFVEALKYGKVQDGPSLQYPMVPYPLLTDEEAKAIYAYLQTVPPINNKVERNVY